MKFKFKIQQYQTEAVEQTVNVFAGQPSKTNAQYRRDLGKTNGRIVYEEDFVGWRNADVELSDKQLLDNIKQLQVDGNIPQSKQLSKPEGRTHKSNHLLAVILHTARSKMLGDLYN